MSYILPQVQVFQIFTQIPQNVVQNLNAFVFGPNYQLFRYSETAERALTEIGAYDNTQAVAYAWPNQPTGSTVDLGYAKLNAENVWAEYFHFDADFDFQLVAGYRNKLRAGNGILATANGYTRSGGLLRDVAVGDRVRYTYDDGAVVHEGITKVVELEADEAERVVGAVEVKTSNPANQDATDLSSAVTVTPGASNSAEFAASTVVALSDDAGLVTFTGSLSAGMISDTITVTITTAGAKGVAKATVSYLSGAYSAFNVSIEDDGTGTNDGKIYLGNNAVLEFVSDASETAFVVGDTYTVELAADFAALDSSDINVDTASPFTGASDTTYMLEVVRGGVFDRTVTVIDGIVTPAGTLTVGPGASASPDWTEWFGGDIDDEYVLKCITGGTAVNAVFSLKSLSGDNDTSIVFGAADTDVDFGARGLRASISAATYVAGQSWVVKVNASRPQLRITDTAGLDASSYVTVSDVGGSGVKIDIGAFGLTATVLQNANGGGITDAGGLRKGDVYYVSVTAAHPTMVKTLVLADDLVSGIDEGDVVDVHMYIVKNGVEFESRRTQSAPDYNWFAADTGITVYDGLQVQDAGWRTLEGTYPWLDVYSADLFVTYRALLPGVADAIHTIENISDVVSELGTVHPDNPLAQGVYNALLNSGNRGVYYMGVPSDDATGWGYVLDRASLSGDVYAFAPLTRDDEILEMVEGHIETMSTETEKRWRIGFFSAAMPEILGIYNSVSHPTGGEYLATISSMTNPLTNATENILVKFVQGTDDLDPSDYTACLTDVKAGDKLRISFATDAWGAATYQEYEVGAIISNTSLRLKSGPAATVDHGTKTEVWHPYTLAEMALAMGAKSSGFYNRRIYNVFPGTLGSGGVVMTGEFGAAAVAGLASSVAPQQPITNIELNGFDDIPLVYRTFNRTQLNKMAEMGTMILMQDMPGSRVYIRHQLSTKASGMNMNETELSLVKNLDSVSYYFANRFAPYIGRYNITPDLVEIINNILEDGVAFLGSMTGTGLIGPQLLLDETEIVGVQQHPSLLDHIVATVNLGLPKPFNVLQLRLVV